LAKSTGTLGKDLDWKNAEPRDGWGDTATNGKSGPRVYSLVGGSLVSGSLRVGSRASFSSHNSLVQSRLTLPTDRYRRFCNGTQNRPIQPQPVKSLSVGASPANVYPSFSQLRYVDINGGATQWVIKKRETLKAHQRSQR